MNKSLYRVIKHGDGWAMEADGEVADIAYVTKEAAFEAIIPLADMAIMEGREVEIRVPPREGDR